MWIIRMSATVTPLYDRTGIGATKREKWQWTGCFVLKKILQMFLVSQMCCAVPVRAQKYTPVSVVTLKVKPHPSFTRMWFPAHERGNPIITIITGHKVSGRWLGETQHIPRSPHIRTSIILRSRLNSSGLTERGAGSYVIRGEQIC